ncbi:MAG: hypothetical protein RL748_4605 [Pseudomonadota bacterium]
MKMKKTLLVIGITAAFATFSSVASANEGMWMPKQLPEISKQLQAAGLKMDPKRLANLTELPMGAMVSLGFCSGSFVSPQGLIVTNYHCGEESIGYNSTPERNLLEKGFLARQFAEEVPMAPGTRITITTEMIDVTKRIISPEVAALQGLERTRAIEKNRKNLIAECEKEGTHRCKVTAFYSGLEFYLIKGIELRDVRLVYAPPIGVGAFGGETDNWAWPRQTGDFSFLRAYVGKDGKPADFSKDNVPYTPKHYLPLAKEGVKEGDFIMSMGVPGSTQRFRMPAEVEYNFNQSVPLLNRYLGDSIAIVEREGKKSEDIKLKYSGELAGMSNGYKNQINMLASYRQGDLLQRKQKYHEELKTWVNADPARKAEFAQNIDAVEALVLQRNQLFERNFWQSRAVPNLVSVASTLYRFQVEQAKPNAERKVGFQDRDASRIKNMVEGIERTYDTGVDKTLLLHQLKQYVALDAARRNPVVDQAMGLKSGMTDAELSALLDKLYADSKLGDQAERAGWLKKTAADFKASNDSFIKLAVALYDDMIKREEAMETIGGKIQQMYSSYMKANLAFMKSKGQAVYPDANSTLRLTFGKVTGRVPGVDGSNWTTFTTLRGIAAKATGTGEFNAPKAQLDAIKARQFGAYGDARLDSVPVNFLGTLDITGGASGSPILNAKGELVGLTFDGTLDTIISDWSFDTKATRSIQVDLRYMLWQMRHIDKADNLLKEMKAW